MVALLRQGLMRIGGSVLQRTHHSAVTSPAVATAPRRMLSSIIEKVSSSSYLARFSAISSAVQTYFCDPSSNIHVLRLTSLVGIRNSSKISFSLFTGKSKFIYTYPSTVACLHEAALCPYLPG
jgi:hypothetical protein